MYIIIVLAIAANKSDLYENEEVNEDEVKQKANELNAIFQRTSAKNATGIDELFVRIGKKFIDPKEGGESEGKSGDKIKLGGKDKGNKKKGCC